MLMAETTSAAAATTTMIATTAFIPEAVLTSAWVPEPLTPILLEVLFVPGAEIRFRNKI